MKRVIFFLAAVLVCSSASAQLFVLSGKVINIRGQAVKGARVILEHTGYKTFTDSLGNFAFTGLPAATYQLNVQKDDFQSYNRALLIGGKNLVVNLILHSKSHQLRELIVNDNHIQHRRNEESLNIEVVNSRFIQRNLGGSLMKTLERLPGVKTIGIGSGQSKPLIRGLGFNRVVVVEKGVKHEGQQWGADHGLEIDQFATGEVEILKGAASFMYGADAIGGVIDIKPAALPQINTLGGSVDLIGKTNNNLYGSSVNLYGRKKHLFFDSRITYQHYADYKVPADTVYVYDFAVPLFENQLRNTAGRETGLHLNTGYVNDHFKSVFYFSNINNSSGFFANAHGLEPRQVNTGQHDASARDVLMPRQQVNHFKLINRSTYQTGKQHFELELGYQHNFRQEFSQYVNHGYMPAVYPDTMQLPADLERAYDKHVYSFNFRNEISMGRHKLMLGLNAEHQDNAISGWTFLVPAFKQTTAGIFAYDKYKVNDQVLLHGAIRYDYGHVRTFKYADWFPSQVTEAGNTYSRYLLRAENLVRNYNSFVWSLGLNYNPDRFFFKANFGKSFRMPIVKEAGANGVNYHYFSYELGDPSLSPEQSYQADLSLGWNEDGWSVQFSPFYNYFPNYIYLNPTSAHSPGPGGGNQIFQYAQSRVVRYGAELQLKYKFLREWTAEFLGEYLQAEQRSGAKKGFTLPFSPPASALLNFCWSPELNKFFTGTYFSLDYRLTAAQNNIVPPERKTPGYRIVNIQAGITISVKRRQVLISLQAQNLFNTRYLNHTSFYRLIELPEAGRNIVLSVKLPFQIKTI